MYALFEMGPETKLLTKSPFSSKTSSASSLSSSSQSLSSDLSNDDRYKNSQKNRMKSGPIITTTLVTAKPKRKKIENEKEDIIIGIQFLIKFIIIKNNIIIIGIINIVRSQ
jgi:hypothetical protein